MSERGYIAIVRGFFEHPIFANEPFTEREAFQWLLFEAAWKPRRVRRGRTIFELERGELAHSERFMATAWKWHRSKVTRFLQRLADDGMIERKTGHEASHIKVCNYDKYQNARTTDEATDRATAEPPANHSRTKLEELNQVTKEEDSNTAREAKPTPLAELSKVLDPERAKAVIDHRQRLRKPLTPHAARLLASKFARAPDPNAAADAMIANGWQGFEPEWLENRKQPRANGPPGKRTVFDAAMDWIAESEIEPDGKNGLGSDVKFLPAAAGKP